MKKFINIFIFILFILLILIFYHIIKVKTTPNLDFKSNSQMKIKSPAFSNHEMMPSKYTCQGNDINPPLRFSQIPENAKSLVLIVDDPDAPDPKAPKMTWVHWLLWNISPKTTKISENSVPKDAKQGKNDFKKLEYGGPCPPIGTHRYFFKLYALDTKLDLKEGSTKNSLLSIMQKNIIAESELIGLYKKK